MLVSPSYLDFNYHLSWKWSKLWNLLQYTSLFHREDQHSITSSTQGTTSLSSTPPLDSSLSDMFRSIPRPLPYDADPRYFRLQRDGLVSRRDKGSSHSHEETEPLRRSEADEDSESLGAGGKWNESTGMEESKEYSRSSLKLSTAKKTATGFAHIYSSSEDEDVCPTCLEGRYVAVFIRSLLRTQVWVPWCGGCVFEGT